MRSCLCYITFRNSVYPDEAAHHEPSHLDIHCLQIQLISLFGTVGVKTALCMCYHLLYTNVQYHDIIISAKNSTLSLITLTSETLATLY